jgi:hypothetical protein
VNGDSKDNPVYIKDVPSRASAISMITNVVALVYTGLVAWQTAKVLVPELAVKEQIAIAWLKRQVELYTGKAREVPVPREWIADLWNDLRGPADPGQ